MRAVLAVLAQRHATPSAAGTTRWAALRYVLSCAQWIVRCRQLLSMKLQRGTPCHCLRLGRDPLCCPYQSVPTRACAHVRLLTAGPATREFVVASLPPHPDDDPDDLEPAAPCTLRSSSSGPAAAAVAKS
jgi:hypothetical protein